MYRKKQIIYTAHCVLNQNSVIRDWERSAGAFNGIVKVLLDNNIGIEQLPCPEFAFLGEDRPPKTKEEYDTPQYRELCKELSATIVKQMLEYQKHQYNIIGILGIGGSPSCDTTGEKGILMETLFQIMEEEGISLEVFDIPEEYIEGENDHVVEGLKAFLKDRLAR